MARIRSIKPEFFTSEDIVELSPLARLFFISLWCEADREGRLSWKLRTLKLRYFPADDCDISELADELLSQDLIELYEVSGEAYAFIPGFPKHQVINNKESDSKLPPCPRELYRVENDSQVDKENPRVKDASLRVTGEGKGKEGKGKERNTRAMSRDAESRFARFWAAYPKKKSKGQAERSWSKLNPDEQLLETILVSLEQAKTSEEWQRANGQYIPHPSTWLNAKGWEDEFNMPAEQTEAEWHESASGILAKADEMAAQGFKLRADEAVGVTKLRLQEFMGSNPSPASNPGKREQGAATYT